MRLIFGLNNSEDCTAWMGTQNIVNVLHLITHCLLAKEPELTRTIDVLFFDLIIRPASRGQQGVNQLLPRLTLVKGHAYRLQDQPHASDQYGRTTSIRLWFLILEHHNRRWTEFDTAASGALSI